MSQPIRQKYGQMKCALCKSLGLNVRTCTNAQHDDLNDGVNMEKACNAQADHAQSSASVADIRGKGNIGPRIQG